MLPLPTLRGVIDRRILLNWRIEPEALDGILPAPFRPRTVDGVAIGGVCCIRLRDVRPRGVPAVVGFGSENAAHRIGVEFPASASADEGEREGNGGIDGDRGYGRNGADWEPGVYVPRRDTSSRLTALVGDRTFGRHGHARFDVREGDGTYELRMESADARIDFRASETDALPADSAFEDLAAAVGYHQCGTVGYSPSPDGRRYEGMELTVDDWAVRPLAVERASASYFEEQLPADAVALDNALLMRNVGNVVARQSPIEACPATAPYPADGRRPLES